MFDTNFHKNSGSQILASFIKDNPQKAATILQTVPLSEAVFWLSSLTLQELSKVLNFMDSKKSAVIIRRLPLKQSAKVLLSLNPTIATDILKYVPPFYKKRLESELTQEEKNLLKLEEPDEIQAILFKLKKGSDFVESDNNNIFYT